MDRKVIVKHPGGSSKVWDYFGFYKVNIQILKDKAICRMGNQEYKYTGGTTNLNQHLQKYHREISKEAKNSCGESSKKIIQAQITSLMKKPTKVLPSSLKYQEYTKAIGKFLIESLVLLSTVDKKGFKNMIGTLSGNTYESPSRMYFCRTLLPKMMAETTAKIKKDILTIDGIGLTTDA